MKTRLADLMSLIFMAVLSSNSTFAGNGLKIYPSFMSCGDEELLTIVKRHKLQWYGNVSRSSGLAKTILRGTVKGGRTQGRQRKRWEDIREWTGLEFAKSERAVENREK